MATALSFPLSDNGHEVRLVGTHLDRETIDSIQQTGVHPDLDLKVPEGVRAYQLEEAEWAFEDAQVAMGGINSFGVRWASEQFASLLKPGMMVIAVTKGRPGDLLFFSEDGSGYLTHVGIQSYDGYLLHASIYYGKVVESELRYMRGLYAARRLV